MFEAEPRASGSAVPTSLVPFSVRCSLGFGLTEHQPWERKIGLHFEKAVRALFFFFFKDICNQISQNRNQSDCQLGAVQGAATVKTKMRSEVTEPRGRKLGGRAGSQLLGLTTALLGGCGLETLGVLQSVRQSLFWNSLCLGNLSPECIAPDGAPPWVGSAGVRTLRNELFLFSCPLCHLW